jgi:hypothetical protein
MPGVLSWAVQGAKRALERGHLLLTKTMKTELDQVHIEGNLVAGFLEECVHYDETKRLSIPYAGIVLNEAGPMFHRAGSDNPHLSGKVASTTDPKGLVNQAMTSEWLAKPCIQRMCNSHTIALGDKKEDKF